MLNSINMIFKSKKNKCMVIEIKILVTSWQRAVIDCEPAQGSLLRSWRWCYFDLGFSYMIALNVNIHWAVHLNLCPFLSIYYASKKIITKCNLAMVFWNRPNIWCSEMILRDFFMKSNLSQQLRQNHRSFACE